VQGFKCIYIRVFSLNQKESAALLDRSLSAAGTVRAVGPCRTEKSPAKGQGLQIRIGEKP